MSLGTKIILLFAGFLLLQSFFSYGVRRTVEEPAYSRIENSMMRQQLQSFRSMLETEAYNLGLLCRNFAENPKVINLASGEISDFEGKSFNSQTCGDLEINILLILDEDNNVLYSQFVGADFQTPTIIAGFDSEKWSSGHPLLGFEKGGKLKRGLLKVKESVIAAASIAISDPQEPEKTTGTIIVGRLLTDRYLARLSDTLGISAKVVSASDAGFREGEVITDGYFYSEDVAKTTHKAMLAINDVIGRPSLAITSQISTALAQKVNTANRISLAVGIAFSLISVLLMLFLVYRIMGERLEKLIDHIIGIRHSGVLVKIVQETGGDEIDLLGYEFNQMVSRIQNDIEMRTKAEIELKRSLSELQRFTDVASHDLQEPLRSVASCLQLLEMQYKEKIDDSGKQLIEYAVQGSKRMKLLIKALLAYSNIGNTELKITSCDSGEIVKQSIEELKEEIEAADAEIIYDSLPVVKADKYRLGLLFTNIINNAVKYKSPQRAAKVKIESKKTADGIQFSITDNGIGIEREYFSQIFVAFRRLHTPDEYEGSGIGLAICRRIIEQHNGKIWVKSEPEKGSTFYFVLPQ